MIRREMLGVGLGLAAALAMAAGASLPAMAQQKMVLKATDVHPVGYPTVDAVIAMGKKLEAATGGRLSIQMFPSMQLGGEKEMIEQAQVGALQYARISVGPMGPIVDELNVFNMPFVFRDIPHMNKVIDGPIGDEMLAKLTASPQSKLVGLCWMDAGARSVYNSKKPIKSIDDLKGLKIRMMGNPIFVDTMNAMGGNGIAMGFDQLYNALQTGVVDGAENNPPSYESGKHFQVAKYYSLTEHLIIPEILVFSKATWDKLSKEDQALISKVAKEAQQEQRKLWNEREAKSMAMIKQAGIEVITMPPAEKKKFQAAVKPVWDKYGAKYADLVKRIQAVN
ncbi:TRAP transporter substrate-binding protein [Desertibaculum subflavum]|uniref:TRAP transporter substrate-binding protein n=1 Tax=Desertibaculum subflavum TaxID=2268458 RepID=UPI000E6698A8